ncbi:MAG TPA: TIGR02757 family protein [Armatimonadota bacterium]|nr:TIGR02757 family protein [Armatimonadota bacterium]
MVRREQLRAALDGLYDRYNRRDRVHPDPVGFLYAYENPLDREIAGLVASCLAYGRVAQIHRSVADALSRLGRPASLLSGATPDDLHRIFDGFRHRFCSGEDLVPLLWGVRGVLDEFGSLERAYCAGGRGGLAAWVGRIERAAGAPLGHVLPSPAAGSACKRLNLFLRWMVRHDDVDPGGWERVSPASLRVPLDVHMHRIGRRLGFTRRAQADHRTVEEVTQAFREVAPHDPVRYDFALARSAMVGDPVLPALLGGD